MTLEKIKTFPFFSRTGLFCFYFKIHYFDPFQFIDKCRSHYAKVSNLLNCSLLQLLHFLGKSHFDIESESQKPGNGIVGIFGYPPEDYGPTPDRIS